MRFHFGHGYVGTYPSKRVNLCWSRDDTPGAFLSYGKGEYQLGRVYETKSDSGQSVEAFYIWRLERGGGGQYKSR